MNSNSSFFLNGTVYETLATSDAVLAEMDADVSSAQASADAAAASAAAAAAVVSTKANLNGGNTFTGGTQVINPTPGSMQRGFLVNQTGVGTASTPGAQALVGFAYNNIYIPNNAINAGNGPVYGLALEMATRGASTNGNFGAALFTANINGPVGPSFGGNTGVTALAQALYPMGGTGLTASTAKGSLYGFNAYSILYGPDGGGAWPGATNIFNATAGEINIKVATGASVYAQTGLQIAALSDHAVQGTAYDIGYSLSAMNGAVGLRNGFAVSDLNGQHPIDVAGTVFGTIGPATVAYGVDVSSYTTTGGSFKGNGFLVDPSGNTNVNSVVIKGSGAGTTTVQSVSTSPNSVSLPVGNTALAGLNSQQTWLAQQLFRDTTLSLLPASGSGVATMKVPNTNNVFTLTLPSNTDTLVGTSTTDLLAPKASPALTGTPTAPTAAVDTNTTQIATTAMVLGQAASATPIMDGAAAVGTSTRYARADHVHPTDTTLAPKASPALTGTPTAPTAAVDTNTTQIATTAMVLGQAASATPLVNGTAAVGTSTRFARADHVHPTDTTLAPKASPSFTGTVTSAGAIAANGGVTSTLSGQSGYHHDISSSAVIGITGSGSVLSANLTSETGGNYVVCDIAEVAAIGGTANYVMGVGSVAMGAAVGCFVASTTTPAAGKASVAYDGTRYKIYSNITGSAQFRVHLRKLA